MFSLIPSDANDPQGLMRRKEPNKQTNKQLDFISKSAILRGSILRGFYLL